MKPGAGFRAVALALALAVSVCAPGGSAAPPRGGDEAPSDYEVKAAFLFHFAKFVEWPEGALPPSGAFVVGVLGTDPFGAILDETLQGKTVLGRPIAVHRYSQPEEVAGCHILFIAASEQRRLSIVMKVLGDRPMLTVGDTEEYAERGVMVNFRVQKKKVRFEINVQRAEAARLRISSQLLKLATLVEGR